MQGFFLLLGIKFILSEIVITAKHRRMHTYAKAAYYMNKPVLHT